MKINLELEKKAVTFFHATQIHIFNYGTTTKFFVLVVLSPITTHKTEVLMMVQIVTQLWTLLPILCLIWQGMKKVITVNYKF